MTSPCLPCSTHTYLAGNIPIIKKRSAHTQNTRRMDFSSRICRRFLRGTCRFGPRCRYLHERQVIPSVQICRYFQKGGCRYGEHCRYLHVLQPEADATVTGRRGSMPTVSSSRVAYAPPDRSGSEPFLLRAQVMSRQECRTVSNPQHNIGRLAADIIEEQSQDTGSRLPASWESVPRSEVAPVYYGRTEQTFSSDTTEDVGAAAAAASGAQGKVEEVEAFLQSKNVTCGICMEKVHEKSDPRNQFFGILSNCDHAFCLQCITTWRKTKDKDLKPDVVKTCPQCRERSTFYVPSKYWVEGQAKEQLIAAFKDKFSKKSCPYNKQNKRCPFKKECLYRHDKHARHRSFPYPTKDEDANNYVAVQNLVKAMTLLGDEHDDGDGDGFCFNL